MTWILAFLGTGLGKAVAGALAVLAALFGARVMGRSEGRAKAEKEAKDADIKRADDIRRRARDADGHGVPDDDKRGWRD